MQNIVERRGSHYFKQIMVNIQGATDDACRGPGCFSDAYGAVDGVIKQGRVTLVYSGDFFCDFNTAAGAISKIDQSSVA